MKKIKNMHLRKISSLHIRTCYRGLLTSDEQQNLDITINTEHAEEDNVPEKLYEERKVMENLKEEIREYGTFELLTNEIERITCHKKEEEALLQQQEELRKTVAELQKIIADEKIANKEKKECVLYELSEEQRNIKKLKLIADAEEEYVMARENAKYEQNQLRSDMEIKKLEKMLNDYRVQERNEDRVHVELTKFLIQETALFEEQAKEWEERYVREKEIYEKEICQLRSDIESRQKELEQLKEENLRAMRKFC